MWGLFDRSLEPAGNAGWMVKLKGIELSAPPQSARTGLRIPEIRGFLQVALALLLAMFGGQSYPLAVASHGLPALALLRPSCSHR